MFFRLKTFLYLALITFSPATADALVHRRNVGPIILDLGNLPPPPVQGDPAQPLSGRGNPSLPLQTKEPPDVSPSIAEPVEVMMSYPYYSELPSALVLTMLALSETAPEQISLIAAPLTAAQFPVLVAYLNPTLARDYALFNPPTDASPKSTALPETPDPKDLADSRTDPGPVSAIDQHTAVSPSRLRTLVIWIWRLLFLIGLSVLIPFWLRRRVLNNNPVLVSSTDPSLEPETSQGLIMSRILRATGVTGSTVADSLSLMTSKPQEITIPETVSTGFGLIEPGATRHLATAGSQNQDQSFKGGQAPS